LTDNESAPKGSQRWRAQRGVLDEVTIAVQSQLSSDSVAGGDVRVTSEPASEPSEGSDWHWHVTFAVGNTETEAILGVDGNEFYFEDDQGYFEDRVRVGEVVEYLRRRIVRRDQEK
jgi:hypothetical protein